MSSTVMCIEINIILWRQVDIIQLMHSFEVNIRICQPENSEHHFQGLTNPDVNPKRMHHLFCYMPLLGFSQIFLKYFHNYEFMQVRCS